MIRLFIFLGLFTSHSYGATFFQSEFNINPELKELHSPDCTSLRQVFVNFLEKEKETSSKTCGEYRFFIKSKSNESSPFNTVSISSQDFSKKIEVRSKGDKKYLYINGEAVEPPKALISFVSCDGEKTIHPTRLASSSEISCDSLIPVVNAPIKTPQLAIKVLEEANSPFSTKTMSVCHAQLLNSLRPKVDEFVNTNNAKVLSLSGPAIFFHSMEKDGFQELVYSVNIQDNKGKYLTLTMTAFMNHTLEVNTLKTTDVFGEIIPHLERPTKINFSIKPSKSGYRVGSSEGYKGTEVTLHNQNSGALVTKLDISGFKCSHQENFNIEETKDNAVNNDSRENLKRINDQTQPVRSSKEASRQ